VAKNLYSAEMDTCRQTQGCNDKFKHRRPNTCIRYPIFFVC